MQKISEHYTIVHCFRCHGFDHACFSALVSSSFVTKLKDRACRRRQMEEFTISKIRLSTYPRDKKETFTARRDRLKQGVN